MLLLKKSIVSVMLLNAVLFIATPAMAYNVDVTISGLESFDLAAFDLNVSYDDTLLTFDSYTLTNELGFFTNPAGAADAEDWSIGDNGNGSVNLVVLSNLTDFSSQPKAFSLATLFFSGEERAMGDIQLFNIVLSDDFGNPIHFTTNGTRINTQQHPGGVVPIPGAIWLLGSGLGVMGIRRKIIQK